MNSSIGNILSFVALVAFFVGCMYLLLKNMQIRLPDEEKDESMLSSLHEWWKDTSSRFTLHKRIRSFSLIVCFVAVVYPVLMFTLGMWDAKEALCFYFLGGVLLATCLLFMTGYTFYEMLTFGVVVIIITGLVSPIVVGIIFDITSSEHSTHPKSFE